MHHLGYFLLLHCSAAYPTNIVTMQSWLKICKVSLKVSYCLIVLNRAVLRSGCDTVARSQSLVYFRLDYFRLDSSLFLMDTTSSCTEQIWVRQEVRTNKTPCRLPIHISHPNRQKNIYLRSLLTHGRSTEIKEKWPNQKILSMSTNLGRQNADGVKVRTWRSCAEWNQAGSMKPVCKFLDVAGKFKLCVPIKNLMSFCSSGITCSVNFSFSLLLTYLFSVILSLFWPQTSFKIIQRSWASVCLCFVLPCHPILICRMSQTNIEIRRSLWTYCM